MSQNQEKADILRDVARQVQKIDNRRVHIITDCYMYQAILREGKEEGRQEERELIARNMLKIGMNHEQVVSVTGLSLERVKQLQQEGEI